MPKFTEPKAQEAYEAVLSWADEFGFDDSFRVQLDLLVSRVRDETELAHMHGKVRDMGKPYMLYRLLDDCVRNERRPIWRGTMRRQIMQALDEYLGLKWEPPQTSRLKRKRRRLLTR